MGKPVEQRDHGQRKDSLRPIDELLEKTYDPGLYPNLVEDYHKLADKDLHLAELYRLAATNLDEQRIVNPVQTFKDDNGLWVDILGEIDPKTSQDLLNEVMQVDYHTDRFISGRVQVQNLPEVNKLVSRVQAARPIRPAVYRSIPSIHADQRSLRQELELNGDDPPDGSEVIVGVVDIGCDFVHSNFRDKTGKTRLLYLWDQRSGNQQSENVPYGREFTANKINDALTDNDTEGAYNTLNYKPADGAHGTHVMDIAAGSSEDFPGVAPGADLIFVHLAIPSPIEVEDEFLGSSKYLYDAVKYIFDKADESGRPAVVNLSLASNGGPHDGTSMVESMFDDLLEDKPGRAIVIAAGNSYQDEIHASGSITPAASGEIEWFIQSHAKTTWNQRQEMEIWYESAADIDVEIFAPNGTPIGSCPLGEIRYDQKDDAEEPVMLIKHHYDPIADDKHINVFIDDRYPYLPLGAYRFQLKPGPAHLAEHGEFHAWIERNDTYPSHFTPNNNSTRFTLNSIGNATFPIIVGAYNARINDTPISFYSSSGPSRNSNAPPKPDISAPGDNIFAARALHPGLDDGIVKSGTSMAAPHVTGLIALIFQVSKDLDSDEVRSILTQTADLENDPERFGAGRINGVNALKLLIP